MRHEPTAPVIALVEDDPHLREELAYQLRHHGFMVTALDSASGLYRQLAVQRFAAVVLDIGLEGENGLDICRHLRAHDVKMGIAFVTARAQRGDRIIGLQAGADAYLTKPVDLEELVLLLQRLTSRNTTVQPASEAPHPFTGQGIHLASCHPVAQSGIAPAPLTQAAAWHLWLTRAELLPPQGIGVRLSLNELQLLGVLCGKAGMQCTHAELGRVLGALPDEWSRHRLEVIISRLRQKVERQTGYVLPLHTVRAVGYMWIDPVTVHAP